MSGCRYEHRPPGHFAVVKLDKGKPRIIGCLECDWDGVIHGDLDSGLTPDELFLQRAEEPERCVAIKRDGGRCRLPSESGDRCSRHRDNRAMWDRSYNDFRSPWRDVSLPEAYREVFIRAIQDAELVADSQQVSRETFEEARRLRHASLVYFVERQGLIKIGTTTSLRVRLESLRLGGCLMPEGMTPGPVALLATTPGDRRIESMYHNRFHKQRVRGEWFRPNKALRRLVDDLQRADRNGRGDIIDQVLETA